MSRSTLFSRASGIAVALCLATTAAAATAAPQTTTAAEPQSNVNGWGVHLTDVTPDPAIRYGTLPNGMRYAIMHNETPKDTASVRLQIEFGSLGEAENERGLAHFIEHMAFNGTTHVPEGDMPGLTRHPPSLLGTAEEQGRPRLAGRGDDWS